MARAILATKSYGSVWVIGYMDDYKSDADRATGDGLPDVAKAVLYSQAQLQGVVCGSYKLFQQYLDAHETAEKNIEKGTAKFNVLKPLVVDEQVFKWEDAKKAFEVQGSGKFVGKVIIDVVSN